jgi:hypothetical protein
MEGESRRPLATCIRTLLPTVGRLDLCQLLLNRGVDPNISRNTNDHGLDKVRKIPVDAALKRGHDSSVQLLLQTGNVSVADELKYGYLLHTAISSCPESIRTLIEHGSDVNKYAIILARHFMSQ